MENAEIWKPIQDYEGVYEISNYGNCRRVGKRNIAPKIENNGYVRFHLSKDNKPSTISAHRAVAMAFIPNPNGCSDVEHKDNDKTNNYVNNLEWKENISRVKPSKPTGEKSIKVRKKCLIHKRSCRLYRSVWIGIKQRCYNEKCKDYPNYGGRGIKVCDEWIGERGFENFREWAYANGYDKNASKGQCTIDRIDVNGDYCPENCRWVNIAFQNANKTTSHLVEYRGETHTVAEWARITGISESALYNRVNRGWDLERVFTQSVRGRKEL